MTPVEAIARELAFCGWEDMSERDQVDCVGNARTALNALTAAGYVVIPRDVTAAMVAGGRAAIACGFTTATVIFNAMVDAHIDATDGPAP